MNDLLLADRFLDGFAVRRLILLQLHRRRPLRQRIVDRLMCERYDCRVMDDVVLSELLLLGDRICWPHASKCIFDRCQVELNPGR